MSVERTEQVGLDNPCVANAVATAYDKDGDSLDDINPSDAAVKVYGDELSASIVTEISTISDWGNMVLHNLEKEHPLDQGEPTEFRRSLVAVVEVLIDRKVPFPSIISDLDVVTERFADGPAEDILAWCRNKDGELP